MDTKIKEIVLITGGSGFIGQHIIRELQKRCNEEISEIRILDLVPYTKKLNYDGMIPVSSTICDITKEIPENLFKGVSCVFHCAAFVSYQYPPDKDQLEVNNILGTENVIKMCQCCDVSRLVFTSTAEITLKPYLGRTYITIIINQTEMRATPPKDLRSLSMPGYSESKFQAEKLILDANGSMTNNGSKLKTVALRPFFVYGEEDPRFVTSVLHVAHKMGGKIPKIAGTGGKQQISYAGNVAWAHVCAMKAMSKKDETISGLPVFITDDTTVADTTRLCEKFTYEPETGKSLCRQSWWSVPLVLSLLIALLSQTLSSIMNIKLPVSPCGLISYLGSIVYFSRLRASIHMDYSPVYNEDESIKMSSKFYRAYYKSRGKSMKL